uniref:Predicted protein n=1 Tax=Hordeum vulgare subsp. vulgare TaxID=112509 RepID=F2DBP1_HORVV|nr:predicted protein [Hordeum vulgare subsp. vulgare]
MKQVGAALKRVGAAMKRRVVVEARRGLQWSVVGRGRCCHGSYCAELFGLPSALPFEKHPNGSRMLRCNAQRQHQC